MYNFYDVGRKWASTLWKTSSRHWCVCVCVCVCVCIIWRPSMSNSSLGLLFTSKLVCGGHSGALWLPSHHPGGCCTLAVNEEIPPWPPKKNLNRVPGVDDLKRLPLHIHVYNSQSVYFVKRRCHPPTSPPQSDTATSRHSNNNINKRVSALSRSVLELFLL